MTFSPDRDGALPAPPVPDVLHPRSPLITAPTFAAACAVLCLTVAPAARATTVACNDATIVNPVYGIGGSAQTPLIGAVATLLAQQATPITVVYAQPGGCSAYNFNNSPITLNPLSGSAFYWDTAGTQHTCSVPATGIPADFGVSGVYPSSCLPAGSTAPDLGNLSDFSGPVLGWDLIVPYGSHSTSISAEAAYLVFGFGGATGYEVPPWTNPTDIIIRNATSAAQTAIAVALGIPATGIQGTTASPNSNTGTISNLFGLTNQDDGLGFVSTDVADANRTKVNVLAYQHFGQSCGYWPDSTSLTFDKANIRSGQYFLWSQTQLVAPASGGIPTNANTAALFALFAPPQSTTALAAIIKTGNIPQCAMNAARETDLGPIISYQPDAPCVGFYEETATNATSHQTCTAADGTMTNQCPVNNPVCRYGYCEVK